MNGCHSLLAEKTVSLAGTYDGLTVDEKVLSRVLEKYRNPALSTISFGLLTKLPDKYRVILT